MVAFGRLRTSIVRPCAAVLLLASATGSALAAGPYPAGQSGYDVSFPQCGARLPGGALGIVGVNGGRPFRWNPCLASEYADAATPLVPALYLNTAYTPNDARFITMTCAGLAATIAGTAAQRRAWAIGCSEADTAAAYASAQGVTRVATWWLDVEIANTWSRTNLTLNRSTLQGAIDRLSSLGPVGVYSSPGSWRRIIGRAGSPRGVIADWLAGAPNVRRAAAACDASFSGAPVWLVQYPGSRSDADYAC